MYDIFRNSVSIATVKPLSPSELVQRKQSDDYVKLVFELNEYIDIKTGDYIAHQPNGNIYTIRDTPEVIELPYNYRYECKFEGDLHDLKDTELLLGSDFNFPYKGDAAKFLSFIVENLNRGVSTFQYIAGESEETDEITVDVQKWNCFEALNYLAEKFDISWYIENKTINFKEQNIQKAFILQTGLLKGLKKITRKKDSNEEIQTVIYGYGGTKNIPERGSKPANDPIDSTYLQANGTDNELTESVTGFLSTKEITEKQGTGTPSISVGVIELTKGSLTKLTLYDTVTKVSETWYFQDYKNAETDAIDFIGDKGSRLNLSGTITTQTIRTATTTYPANSINGYDVAIKFNGIDEFINTGITANEDVYFEAIIKQNGAGEYYMMGARNNATGAFYFIQRGNASYRLRFNAPFTQAVVGYSSINETTFNKHIYDGTCYQVDDQTVLITPPDITVNKDIYIGAANNSGSLLFPTNCEYMSLKMWEGSTLVRDYVDVEEGYAGIGGQAQQNGFYDILNDTFTYGNTPLASRRITANAEGNNPLFGTPAIISGTPIPLEFECPLLTENRLYFEGIDGDSKLEKNVDLYGRREIVKIYEDIFPQRLGEITSVNSLLSFVDTSQDFDINEYMLSEVVPKIYMVTGRNIGKTFDISNYDHATKTLTILEHKDESGAYPSELFALEVGDEYELLDAELPDSYIIDGQNRLEEKTQIDIDLQSSGLIIYTAELDYQFLQRLSERLNLGDVARVVSGQLGIDEYWELIEVTQNIENPKSYNIKFGDLARKSLLNLLSVRQFQTNQAISSIINNTYNKRETTNQTTIITGEATAWEDL